MKRIKTPKPIVGIAQMRDVQVAAEWMADMGGRPYSIWPRDEWASYQGRPLPRYELAQANRKRTR